MADRGRDIELNFISNAAEFDVDEPARQLKDIGADATDAEKKVERAFEGMSAASRQASRKIDDDFDKASRGVDDFKDEAKQSGREAAASFSGGFEDIGDFIQETAANAFGGFGPAGMAAGIAAAAGIGLITNALNSAKERVKELAQGIIDLRIEGLDTTAAKIEQVLQSMRDTGDLARFRQAARDAGIDWKTYVRALSEGGPTADAVRRQLGTMIDGFGGAEAVLTAQGRAANDLYQHLRDTGDAMTYAADSTDAWTEGLDAATRAELDAAAAAEENARRHEQNVGLIQSGFDRIAAGAGDLTAKVQAEAQAQADATKDTGDSWDDYADSVRLSAADVAGVLNEQTKALEDFRANMLTIQKRGDEEFTAWAAQQPANVAAAYAAGTAAERETIYQAYLRNVGARAAAGTAAGMRQGAPAVAASAQHVHDVAAAALKVPVKIPVGLSPPAYAAVQDVVGAVRAAIGTLSVPVRPVVGSVYIPNQYAMRPIP